MNEFDDLENTLAAELRRRSGDVLGTEGLADRARRRARVVRRRRAVAVGAVTAVALAIAVPTALSLRSVPQTAGEPAGPPTTSETPSPDPSPATPSPDPTTPPPTAPESPATELPPDPSGEPEETEVPADLSDQPGGGTDLEPVLSDLPEGAPPSIGYLEGDTFHRTDGRSVPLPGQLFKVLELGTGFLATNTNEVAFVDAGGAITASFVGAGPVLSPDGALAAYYNDDEDMVLATQADGGGSGPGGREVPGDQRLEPVGFLDDYRLVSNVSAATGESAGIRIDQFAPGEPTAPTTPSWGLVRVSAVSAAAGLVAGYTEIGDGDACSAVFEDGADQPLWDTCQYSFDHFSPDGQYLVGSVAYRDGEGNPFAVVVEARTGVVVHTYDVVYVHDTVFEDDDSLLISVRLLDGDTRQAALVRCDFYGSCERATPIVRVGWEESAYGLGLQRW